MSTAVVQIGALLEMALGLADLAGETLLGAMISGAADRVDGRLAELGGIRTLPPFHPES